MAQFELSPESKVAYPLVILSGALQVWDKIKPESVDDGFKYLIWLLTAVYLVYGILIRRQKLKQEKQNTNGK